VGQFEMWRDLSDFAQTARLSTGIIVGSSTQARERNMKTRYTVALSMLSGIAIGAVAIQGLHAQATPKAYTVTEPPNDGCYRRC
jgi:hypothetical protein